MLLVTQWLSLTHSITHITRYGEGSVAAHHDDRRAAAQGGSWLDTVVNVAAHHDDKSPLCRLIDQLCHSAPAPSVPVFVTEATVFPLPHVARVDHWSSPALGHYRARAPPALS